METPNDPPAQPVAVTEPRPSLRKQKAKKDETALKDSLEDIQKQNAQLEKESKPMWLTNAFVDWSGTMLFLGFAFLVLSTYFAMIMDYFKMEYQSHRDILVWTDPIVQHTFMQERAYEFLEQNQKSVKKIHPLQQTPVKKWSALMLFELDSSGTDVSELSQDQYGHPKLQENPDYVDYGLLNKEFLLNMENIEKSIQENPKWKQVCFVDKIPEDEYNENKYNCSAQLSILSPLVLFRYLGINNISDATQDKLVNGYEYAKSNKEIWDLAGNFFIEDQEKPSKVILMKMMLQVGGPLKIDGRRYKDVNDGYQE